MTAQPRAFAFTDEVPPEKIEWIGGFATPPALPMRPLHALVSVFRLMRNKEDTRQVFEVIRALSGGSAKRLFRRFVVTPYGEQVVSRPVKVEEILSDRTALRALPEGSLGRAYLDFMEGENLTADGLIASAEEAGIDFTGETQFPEFRRMFLHLDVIHDLWHVLTGYGRDALGELCNLTFTRAQTRNRGIRLIVWIGLLAMQREQPGQPIWRAASEARRIGMNARWVLAEDVEALLPLPLAEARRRLNIPAPAVYNSIPDEVKRTLLKPRVAETQSQREARLAA
jgi:ubiquinone biosynthesis protein COQ4